MILEMTRGHVRLKVADGRTVTIHGEALLPGADGPDFVAYEKTIDRWDPPDEAVEIGSKEKALLLATLRTDLAERGMVTEVEGLVLSALAPVSLEYWCNANGQNAFAG